MKDINFIASINERDIDLLILEELTVSDEFLDWFSARLFGCTVYSAAAGAWHSVVAGDNRESDLLFIFLSQSGERIAILIENKIDAPPQPQQAKGYAAEALQGLIDWAGATHNIKRYRSVVTEGNVASEKVLRKCGFALQHIAANAHCIGGKSFADHVYQLQLSANHL